LLAEMTSTEDPAARRAGGTIGTTGTAAPTEEDPYFARVQQAMRTATGGFDTFSFPQSMLSGFEGEEQGPNGVPYLRTQEERAPYEVRVNDQGKLYYVQTGKLLDTRPASLCGDRSFGVISVDGLEMYICAEPGENRLQHSSFKAGGEIGAGFVIEGETGQPGMLSPATGHYGTTPPAFREFLRFLGAMGMKGNVFAPPARLSNLQQDRLADVRGTLHGRR
jgi:hypothetical protein